MLVLIVDSDPDRSKGADRLVQRAGGVTLTAADPRMAMLLFVRREPAVSVLQASSERDLGLCRDMKALKAGRRRAVIICGPRELRAAAFESGCDAFVAEGPDPLPLQRAVRRLLTAARPASSGHGIEVVA